MTDSNIVQIRDVNVLAGGAPILKHIDLDIARTK